MTILLIVIVVVASTCYIANERHLVYALDDPYIHMAIAKNLAFHGNWGITPSQFSSSSSSLLWTCVLAACYRLFGVSELFPLFLNCFAAIGCLWYVFRFGQRFHLHPLHNLATQIAFVLFVPLLPVLFTGMEHIAHMFLMLMLTFHALDILSQPAAKTPPFKTIAFLATASLAVMTRYESLFLVSFIIGLAFLFKRYRLGIGLAACSCAPVIAFGLVSLVNGHYFLPNTLMVKGHFPHLTSLRYLAYSFGYAALELLSKTPHLLVVIVAMLALYVARSRMVSLNESRQYLLLGVVYASALHAQFAAVGWFYRYEAYLMALGIVAVSIALPDIARQACDAIRASRRPSERIPILAVVALLTVMFTSPIWVRGNAALESIVPATRNIYDQQYQIGRFLSKYYRGASLAVNDIGATSFFSAPENLLDLWGLGSVEIIRAKRKQDEMQEVVSRLSKAQRTRLIVVYASRFEHVLPQEWIPIGTWTISNNIVCGDATVTFLAANVGEVPYALHALRDFSHELPASIVEEGMYVADNALLR